MYARLQVELFEFRGEDITENEDGGIIRRIITKGRGYSKPNEGAAVEGSTSRDGYYLNTYALSKVLQAP